MEDAIRTLKEHKIMFQHDFGWDRSTLEALDTAIEALSAEPCGDAVSRQAVIDTTICDGIVACNECSFHTLENWTHVCLLRDRVMKLPPVTPKVSECEDCISRAELLRAIDTYDKFGCDANTKLVPYQDYYVPYIHYYDVVNCIKGMPPVTPKQKMGFDGMTNGEVIKTLFPSCKTRHENTPMDNFMEFTLDGIVGYAIEKSWWNAPYKAESENKK